jgi:DNA phosphorothioation-associated putative methyltransferase
VNPLPLRQNTAISRTDLSRPLRIAYDAGLIRPGSTVFDYGCGRGDDIRLLSTLGVSATGWDPAFSADAKIQSAEVVNLGYVVNVIEDRFERDKTLEAAWQLAKSVLIVAARLQFQSNGATLEQFTDGCLTARGTFQKFYTQLELREWVKSVLQVEPFSAGPGILLLFRDPSARLRFEASRWRRRSPVPRQRLADQLFQSNRQLLEPMMAFAADRGRIPHAAELTTSRDICGIFGSLKRAFRVVTHATGSLRWDEIRQQAKTDLLVYLALDRFGGRPRFSQQPQEIQGDIKAFFGSYTRACSRADELLFAAGDMGAIGEACTSVETGKLTPEALYVHESAVQSLPAILRVYEGCARAYIGKVEGANLIKLNRLKPKISYLAYPGFDVEPHPALLGSLVVSLRSLDLQHYDYGDSTNPPILHRKELFVPPDYPLRPKFERLTRQEERFGLYEGAGDMGTKAGWERRLKEKGVRLSGHRLLRTSR